MLSSKTRRSSSRIAAARRLAATTIGLSDTELGAFYRRLSSRIGKAKAVTATARKLAILFYNALKYSQKYVGPGADYMKSATVVAYSMGLSEEQNHWVTLSSKILNYACEPGVSQDYQLHPIVNSKVLKCEIVNIVASKSMLLRNGYLSSTNS